MKVERADEKKGNTCKYVMIHSTTSDLLYKIKYFLLDGVMVIKGLKCENIMKMIKRME